MYTSKKIQGIVDSWYKIAKEENDFTKTLRLCVLDMEFLPNIPDECEDLDIGINLISHIHSLPKNLRHLNLMFNRVSSLPPLPEGLISLDIYANKFNEIPTLPSSLKSLKLGANPIEKIPLLPSGLTLLHAYGCGLTDIHDLTLPVTLKDINLSTNSLTAIPCLDELNDLEVLDISENKLVSMPSIPKNLKFLRKYDNPFTDAVNRLHMLR